MRSDDYLFNRVSIFDVLRKYEEMANDAPSGSTRRIGHRADATRMGGRLSASRPRCDPREPTGVDPAPARGRRRRLFPRATYRRRTSPPPVALQGAGSDVRTGRQ